MADPVEQPDLSARYAAAGELLEAIDGMTGVGVVFDPVPEIAPDRRYTTLSIDLWIDHKENGDLDDQDDEWPLVGELKNIQLVRPQVLVCPDCGTVYDALEPRFMECEECGRSLEDAEPRIIGEDWDEEKLDDFTDRVQEDDEHAE